MKYQFNVKLVGIEFTLTREELNDDGTKTGNWTGFIGTSEIKAEHFPPELTEQIMKFVQSVVKEEKS